MEPKACRVYMPSSTSANQVEKKQTVKTQALPEEHMLWDTGYNVRLHIV